MLSNLQKFKFTYLRFKAQKKTNKGYAYNIGSNIVIKSRNNFISKPNHYEIIRRNINQAIKKTKKNLTEKEKEIFKAYFSIHLSTNYKCSKKPLQSRMGKGKGKPSHVIGPFYKGMPIATVTISKIKNIKHIIPKIQYRLPTNLQIKHINTKTLFDSSISFETKLINNLGNYAKNNL